MTQRWDLDRAQWRTSSYSTGSGSNCVEVGPTRQAIGIRDTKNRAAGALAVSPHTWSAFVISVKAG